jgi:hypothetical protein
MESEAGVVKQRFRLARLSCEMVTATPEMALRWLGNNPRNRPLDMERVQALREKIRCGTWKPNPPVEVFDSGRLWNGQHRLTAIVQEGVAVPLRVLVWEKVPVDSGKWHFQQRAEHAGTSGP